MKSLALLLFLPFLGYTQSLTYQDFLAQPEVIAAKVSPNGKHLASVWNVDDYRYVRVFDISGEKFKLVGRIGDNIIRPYDVRWANDERILVKLSVPARADRVRRDSETKEDFDINDYFKFGRVISADITFADTVELMSDDHTVRKTVNLAKIRHLLKEDKEHILMSAYRRGRITQFRVNVYSGESEMVARGGPRTYAFINDKKGELRYRYDYLRRAKAVEIFEYKGDNDWESYETFYFDEDDQDKNSIRLDGLLGMYQDNLVYLRENQDTGFHELRLVEKDGNDTYSNPKILASYDDRDITGVITNGFDSEVIGYRTLLDVRRSHYFEQGQQELYDSLIEYFPHENFYFSSVAADGDTGIIVAHGDSNPITYYLYNFKTGGISLFSYPYTLLPPEKLAYGAKTMVTARDKLKFRSYLLFPPEFDQTKPFPLVVLPHGGPHSRDSQSYDDFAQFIATRGYIVMKPNFRGSTGYGREFMEAGFKQWGQAMQDDIEDAVQHLIKQKLVDPKRICIVGISYGGYAALMGTVKTPDLYQCSISLNGVTDLVDMAEHDLDRFEDSEKVLEFLAKSFGTLQNDKAMLQAQSPINNVAKIKTPILIIAGDEDKVVPFSQSKRMYEKLKDNKRPVRFLHLEDTGHNPIWYREDIESVYKEVEEFLALYL